MRFLLVQFSSLSTSLWTAAQPSGVSAIPPSFVSSVDVLRVFELCPTYIINEDAE